MYDAVLFDNDGVLTHPTPSELVRSAARAAFREFGADPRPDDVDHAVDGSPDRVERACGSHGVDPEAYWTSRESRAASAQRSAMRVGSKPLYADVSAVRDLPVPTAVVSNNQHATVEAVVEEFGLDGAFETWYGREPSLRGARRKKPSPYYLERALADLDLAADARTLYVGDSNVDLLAAEAAGMDAAFVRRPHREGYELATDPDHELRSLADLESLV